MVITGGDYRNKGDGGYVGGDPYKGALGIALVTVLIQ